MSAENDKKFDDITIVVHHRFPPESSNELVVATVRSGSDEFPYFGVTGITITEALELVADRFRWELSHVG